MIVPTPVSVHGGHSGQFCGHASDTLEAIVRTYIRKGYPWVGITEHMPPASDRFLYPEERAVGLDARALKERFADYIGTCRLLQKRYADAIRIFVGFETETTSGSIALVRELIATHSPDYVVGSVHHVDDIPFDSSRTDYETAAAQCGGTDGLYARYFDQQYEMIQALRPEVVGHLDIIRIFDPDYRSRLVKPAIWEKIMRNLELIKKLDLILDFNLRPLTKGADEPYLSTPILKAAGRLGIAVVPGDDSHGVKTIGVHMQTAIRILRLAGVSTNWRKPVGKRFP
ncbi:putative histidinol-phosphatase [Desulfosarcina ovata subsp. sediminis]|uniref:Histidinol-phosphatase n=1 Tax=Desulfosarcina ovata subsp. sediminis TaxID=885957 RepID=A0A5K7ZES2_9BACT|nr:histidinol-phosphatase [Desulfosarcina ovata]BBO80638.1 putative histidinol-phosphatase [Desulfosarcina ovata subsp. sediminis]